MLKEPMPQKIVNLVVGFDDNFNFVNLYDPENPTPLYLDLSQRCQLVFILSDALISAGWTFQKRPIEVVGDFGINFSSYSWVTEYYGNSVPFHTCFKIIYECKRMGDYNYSLFMMDSYGQKIGLDPKIQNGTGEVP